MQRDLDARELVFKHYDACYSSDAQRRENNRLRALQRRLFKLEAENAVLKSANVRWREACRQRRESYANVSFHVRSLDAALRTQHWL